MHLLETEIKQLIIDALQLEDMSVSDIDSETSLFGDGLGLDSIDALELGMALQKKYGITLSADSDETREHFKSVQTIVNLIKSQEKK